MNKQINEAVTILNQGGIVIFPTDTAFGIGCRIDFPESVKRLFLLRRRPENQAVPVLVEDIQMAEKYLHSPLPDNVRHLMDDTWPGAVTVIYTCRENAVSPLVRGGSETLGVRMPDNKVILEIIKKTGVPVLGPSANFHGEKTAFAINELNHDLTAAVDFVVEGNCKLGQASTVIDASISPWKILRIGAAVIDIGKYK